MDKLRVGIVAATGVIGQQFVESLYKHPWFEIAGLYASERSAGKKLGEAIKGREYGDIPEEILEMRVYPTQDIFNHKIDLCFSGLEADVGRKIEPKIAEYTHMISTSSAFRLDSDVSILLPHVNPEHAEIVRTQKKKRGWESLSTISNCTTRTLVLPLKPIYDNWGIKELHMGSMQALSGAGEEGVRKNSVYRTIAEANVIPFIPGEEEKVDVETKKILGSYENGRIVDAEMRIYPACNRVPVEDGHTENVFVKTREECSVDDVMKALKNFTGMPQKLKLPSAPERPIVVFGDPTSGIYETYRPQPKIDAEAGKGMITSVGRVRKVHDEIAFVTCSHNTRIGGADGAILIGEYLHKTDYI
ncbi:MAG: aspartate-semialdehyde dehydrogenase [Candidatus Aenigmatarchaeota archaeon]